jgi:hypothetical protein
MKKQTQMSAVRHLYDIMVRQLLPGLKSSDHKILHELHKFVPLIYDSAALKNKNL